MIAAADSRQRLTRSPPPKASAGARRYMLLGVGCGPGPSISLKRGGELESDEESDTVDGTD